METTDGLSLAARVYTLERLSRWARSSFGIWVRFEEAEDPVRGYGDLEVYRPFLTFSGHVHREVAVIYLNSIFETRSDTVNVKSVARHLREHGVGLPLLDAIDKDLAGHRAELVKLYRLRGAAIGHRSQKASYDETFASVRVTHEDLGRLLDLSDRCAVRLAEAAGCDGRPMAIDPNETAGKMLADLRELAASKPDWWLTDNPKENQS